MRPRHRLLLMTAVVTFTGCARLDYTPPQSPMPPHTILLSQMMQELSARPGFTEAMLAQLDKGGKKGPALLTPRLVDDLRQRILGKNWQGLDRFPGWTMREINPTVRTVGHLAGKNEQLENAAAVHPGASPSSAETRQYLDLGPYSLEKAETISLETPSTLAPFTTNGIVLDLGAAVTRGDGPNALASEHAESQRLADVLNRLSANTLSGVAPARAQLAGLADSSGSGSPVSDEEAATSPDELILRLQQSGHIVTVQDARYFANFGHFHYKGQDVMMPFWVNSQIIVPHSDGRPLLVPVSHAEYEWHIRGPHLNADVSYYFGIDGKSQWRTMDTLDQAWVLKRNAHTYTGADAVEVTRLASALTIAYMHLHAAHPTIPFGGYYAFGVCQDGVSAIEKKMTGKVTLFPNTADSALFNDPRDTEVNHMIAAIPKDRAGRMPEPGRIFGSLPVDPVPNGDFSSITIPGLAADLTAVHFAWTDGSLERANHRLLRWCAYGVLLFGGLAALYAVRRHNLAAAARRKPMPQQDIAHFTAWRQTSCYQQRLI